MPLLNYKQVLSVVLLWNHSYVNANFLKVFNKCSIIYLEVIFFFQEQMDGFFTVLALCHTVRVDRKDNNGTVSHCPTGFDYEYQASSPDEKAFVEACRR